MLDLNVGCDDLAIMQAAFPPMLETEQGKARTICFAIVAGQIVGVAEYYLTENEQPLIIESPIVALSESDMAGLSAQIAPHLTPDLDAEIGLHITPTGSAHFAFMKYGRGQTRHICKLAARHGWAMSAQLDREWRAINDNSEAEIISVSSSASPSAPVSEPAITFGADRGEALTQIRRKLDRYIAPLGETHKERLSAVLAHDRFERGDMSNNFMAEEFPNGFDVIDLGIGHSRHIAAIAAILMALTQEIEGASRWNAQVNNQFADNAFTIDLDITPSVIFAAIDEDGDKATIEIEVKTDWIVGRRVAEMQIDGRLMIVQARPKDHAGQEGYIITYRGGLLDVSLVRLAD